ncbi:MAG: response regulator [Gammaproteobacteria bacterium]|nr:response regulator [Gammaproteobacteria bacterium]MBT7306890.1 response regulator [Gammaproteobacteria bacterium]
MASSNRKVLVVDDDPNVLDAYEEILVATNDDEADRLMELLTADLSISNRESNTTIEGAKDDFEMVKAASAEEAIELFTEANAADAPFSTVFMDIRMPPGMDGVECSARLLEIDPTVFVVVVSAYADYSLSDINNHLGRDYIYLKKPFIPEELIQVAEFFSLQWNKNRVLKQRITALELELDQCKKEGSPQ